MVGGGKKSLSEGCGWDGELGCFACSVWMDYVSFIGGFCLEFRDDAGPAHACAFHRIWRSVGRLPVGGERAD